MTDHTRSERQYTEDEIKAMRRLGHLRVLNITPLAEERGIPYFATGSYYPDLLDNLAKDYERAAKDAALVATALRREFDRWPEK